jgi:hypothetical protein
MNKVRRTETTTTSVHLKHENLAIAASAWSAESATKNGSNDLHIGGTYETKLGPQT